MLATAAFGLALGQPVYAGELPIACSLLTSSEAASILGEPIADVSATESAVISHCGFDPGAEDGAYLTVDIESKPAGTEWDVMRTPSSQTIDGLGDDAYMNAAGQFGGLEVLRGQLVVGFGINIAGGDAAQALPGLARTVMARLP